MLEEYKGKVKLELYHLPFNPLAEDAAQAAICAGEQGKFWEYSHKLFEKQESWPRAADPVFVFSTYARAMGLDREAFAECLRSRRHLPQVKADVNYGLSLGVDSTPTFFFGDVRLVGPSSYNQFRQILEGLIK